MSIGTARNIRAVILGSALLLAATGWAREKTDVIIMKNGDHMTGEIKGLNQATLYVSLDYVVSTMSVDWSKVARLESKQLFIVKTEEGSVYTGTLRMTETPAGRPVQIQEVEDPREEVAIDSSRLVQMTETSEKFWQRFNGAVSWGIIYAKGNQSTQYNLGSQTEYLRERWSASANLTSNLSVSSGVTAATRNQLNLNGQHLMRWNNYFYGGLAGFLQSSEQGIQRQTSLGGGIGRYLKNTDRATLSVLGGFAWQETRYQHSTTPIGTQDVAAGLIAANLKLFKFNKTNLNVTAVLLPALSQPGRLYFNTNATYYLKITGNLSWNISFYGNWDTQPPANLPGSDYGTSSGLSWTFGLK